jgi:hypothetical protein
MDAHITSVEISEIFIVFPPNTVGSGMRRWTVLLNIEDKERAGAA